jgi:5S rRNA maturation endonuclease (ribonuclease M5)
MSQFTLILPAPASSLPTLPVSVQPDPAQPDLVSPFLPADMSALDQSDHAQPDPVNPFLPADMSALDQSDRAQPDPVNPFEPADMSALDQSDHAQPDPVNPFEPADMSALDQSDHAQPDPVNPFLPADMSALDQSDRAWTRIAGGGFPVPTAALDSKLSPGVLRVYVAVCFCLGTLAKLPSRRNRHTDAASRDRLARLTGLHPNAVSRALLQLEKAGLLQREQTRNDSHKPGQYRRNSIHLLDPRTHVPIDLSRQDSLFSGLRQSLDAAGKPVPFFWMPLIVLRQSQNSNPPAWAWSRLDAAAPDRNAKPAEYASSLYAAICCLASQRQRSFVELGPPNEHVRQVAHAMFAGVQAGHDPTAPIPVPQLAPVDPSRKQQTRETQIRKLAGISTRDGFLRAYFRLRTVGLVRKDIARNVLQLLNPNQRPNQQPLPVESSLLRELDANGRPFPVRTNKSPADRLEEFRRHFPGAVPNASGEVMLHCPWHDDNRPSLSVNPDKGVFRCFGCGRKGRIEELYTRLALNPGASVSTPKLPATPQYSLAAHCIAERHIYRDADGKPVCAKARIMPQHRQQLGKYRWLRPAKLGARGAAHGWMAGLPKGFQPPLYHLPEVLKARTVIVVEGEQDADTLQAMGLRDRHRLPIAVTTAGGVNDWKGTRHAESLRGKLVLLMLDNDTAGKQAQQRIASTLASRGICKQIVPVRKIFGTAKDVTEWVDDLAAKFDGGGIDWRRFRGAPSHWEHADPDIPWRKYPDLDSYWRFQRMIHAALAPRIKPLANLPETDLPETDEPPSIAPMSLDEVVVY